MILLKFKKLISLISPISPIFPISPINIGENSENGEIADIIGENNRYGPGDSYTAATAAPMEFTQEADPRMSPARCSWACSWPFTVSEDGTGPQSRSRPWNLLTARDPIHFRLGNGGEGQRCFPTCNLRHKSSLPFPISLLSSQHT